MYASMSIDLARPLFRLGGGQHVQWLLLLCLGRAPLPQTVTESIILQMRTLRQGLRAGLRQGLVKVGLMSS